jgi:hypothetical protein
MDPVRIHKAKSEQKSLFLTRFTSRRLSFSRQVSSRISPKNARRPILELSFRRQPARPVDRTSATTARHRHVNLREPANLG